MLNELALAYYAAERGIQATSVRASDTKLIAFLRTFDEETAQKRLHLNGIDFTGASDHGFPNQLRSIHDAPVGLFSRSCPATQTDAWKTMLDQPAVAVVGARACSSYGASVARTLGRDLAKAGITVVSGLARGVDAEAHRGALEAGGTTVAVLGCGVDRDYPAAHSELARRIVEAGGIIMSEYAPGVEPAPWRFPARNRIVAGMCAATIVVEARERSGALITADLALEEGRQVFAVPGEITTALSVGTNRLLQVGATPCLSAQDVIEAVVQKSVPA